MNPSRRHGCALWMRIIVVLLASFLTVLHFMRNQPRNTAAQISTKKSESNGKKQSAASIESERPLLDEAPVITRDYSQYIGQYRILDEACLEVRSDEESNMYVLDPRDKQQQLKTSHTSATVTGAPSAKKKKDFKQKITIFRGDTFVEHVLHITFVSKTDHRLLVQRGGDIRKNGTTMPLAHHTPDNNFHLQNDLLLLVWRAYHLLNINRILLFRGCVDCWVNRLPLMGRIFESMQLEVIFPIEDMRLQCFERIVIQQKDTRPYYSHKGRFDESFWPQHFFFGYRDHVHAYFSTTLFRNSSRSSTTVRTNPPDKVSKNWFKLSSSRANSTKDVIPEKSEMLHVSPRNSTPILTWVSRSRHKDRRYVANERNVLQALSQYFQVHLIDFVNRSFTVDDSLAYIMETNVLVGMHGAGLGYTALLPNNSMLVEIKGTYGSEKKMFMNMASMLDIPYYAVHPDVHDEVVTLANVSTFAKEIYDAWMTEQTLLNSTYNGECVFPSTVYPLNHLSTSNFSRCYLEKSWKHNFEWYQCVHFNVCY